MSNFFKFESQEQFNNAVKTILAVVTQPRQVAKAYALHTTKQVVSKKGDVTVEQFEKTPIRRLPSDILEKYTGEVLLKYQDGSSAICDLKNGKREGAYERYAPFAGNSDDPMDKGPLLESASYVKDELNGLLNAPLSLVGVAQFAPRVQIRFEAGQFVSAGQGCWKVTAKELEQTAPRTIAQSTIDPPQEQHIME